MKKKASCLQMDGTETVMFAVGDNMRLSVTKTGPFDGFPVILSHGGGQTSAAWRQTAAKLAMLGFRCTIYDQRGHGVSDWSPDHDYRLDRFRDDLRAIVHSCSTRPVVVGASLGGLSGMLVAGEGDCRDDLAGLVLVDIAARMSENGSDRINDFMKTSAQLGFASVEEAAERISAYLPHRKKLTSIKSLARNMRLFSDGRYRWNWDPEFLMGELSMVPDYDRLSAACSRIEIPVSLIRGGQSELITREAVEEMRELIPCMECHEIPGASHMVVGDNNDKFFSVVKPFLSKIRKAYSEQMRPLVTKGD